MAGGVGVSTTGGSGGGTVAQSHQQSQQQSTNQSGSSQASTSFIPNYSESPILQSIAQYAQNMAPQVYNWGMEQWGKNQGNIDAMMRSALTYASPQRVANEMGMAEAGVMQGAEAGRQAAIRDLESYGLDPSSGRYQQLDNASRVMAGASAAGAGNQQRMATEAQGNAMQQQALSAGMQNTAMGYGASSAMKGLLDTGMSLKYAPLGQQSAGTSESSGQSTGFSQSESLSGPAMAGGGDVPDGPSDDSATTGGFVSQELSPSAGSQIDDVDARLNAGEFVIPKDVVEWKGKEYFYKLMAQARKLRATAGQDGGGQMGYQEEPPPMGEEAAPTGYAGGGDVLSDRERMYGAITDEQRRTGSIPDQLRGYAMGSSSVKPRGMLAGGPVGRQVMDPAVQGMRIHGAWHPWTPETGIRQIGGRAGRQA